MLNWSVVVESGKRTNLEWKADIHNWWNNLSLAAGISNNNNEEDTFNKLISCVCNVS